MRDHHDGRRNSITVVLFGQDGDELEPREMAKTLVCLLLMLLLTFATLMFQAKVTDNFNHKSKSNLFIVVMNDLEMRSKVST